MWFHQVMVVEFHLKHLDRSNLDFANPISMKEDWVVVNRDLITISTPMSPSEYHAELHQRYQTTINENRSRDYQVFFEFHFKFSIKES